MSSRGAVATDATAAPPDGMKTGAGKDRRWPRWLRWLRWGSRELSERDIALCDLVKLWVKQTWPEDNKVKLGFVRAEFESRLGTYRNHARAWRSAQISIWLLITLLGVLISVLAGFNSAHGFIIVAGAVIATLTTLTNALHPGRQAEGYQTARLALRDQGWLLLNRIGTYATPGDDEKGQDDQYKLFIREVHRIVETKRTSTNLDLDGFKARDGQPTESAGS